MRLYINEDQKELLGKNGNPRAKTRDFAFTGMIKCDECGCQITAEAKKKYIKSKNIVRHYTYYHCTHKKRSYKCKQKSVEEKELKNQIDEQLKTLEIKPLFKNLAFKIIDDLKNEKPKNDNVINQSLISSLEEAEKELKSLNRMKRKEFISDEEYLEDRKKLTKEIENFKNQLDKIKTPKQNNDWVELTKATFELATHGRLKLKKGTLEEQKTILNQLGSNQALVC